MLDTGLWLFVGLVALFIWRGVSWWHCCGKFNRFLNYMSLLLVLNFAILAYDTYEFCITFVHGRADGGGDIGWTSTPQWLKFLVYCGPFIAWVNFVLGSHQVLQHIVCIRDQSAVLRHDRAVQIIILPTVYGTMCFSCMSRCYAFLMVDKSTAADNTVLSFEVTKAETCLWIGDLYESWALYQFGVLSLEVMEGALMRQTKSPDPEEQAAANALLVSHKAVTRLAWIGILSFVLVSVADSAVALVLLQFGDATPGFVHRFNSAESQFDAAGFLASCAAIYNVYVVEQTFHHFLQEFHPFLKFLTVKILVSFAYFQLLFFDGLQYAYGLAPKHVQDTVFHIPVIGSIVVFNNAEFYAFYAALLILECFLIAMMHVWAWGHTESWYESDEVSGLEDADNIAHAPSRKLMPGESLLYGSLTGRV